jgi:PAS domain S-box-containing protein
MEIRPDILEPAVMYELLAMAVEQTADSIVVTDPIGTIIFVNPGFEVTTGYTSKEAIGQTPKLLKSGHHSEEFYKDLWGRIRSGQHFRGTILNKKRNGSLYWSEQTITPIKE